MGEDIADVLKEAQVPAENNRLAYDRKTKELTP